MKIEKLFKKAESFFGLKKKEQKKNDEKKIKLMSSLEKKIFSMKNKIKQSNNKQKKDELKEVLVILQKIKDKF